MTAILDSAPARQATQTTRQNWQEYRDRKERQFRDGFEEFVRRCVQNVDDWKRLAEVVHVADMNDEITDFLEIGNEIGTYASVTFDLLQSVCKMAERLPCGTAAADLKIATFEMSQVDAYFKTWPTSNSETVRAIREEFAKGQDRDFQEFVDEVSEKHSLRGTSRS